MKSMKTAGSVKENIYKVLWQLLIIALFFEIFFAAACLSPLYADWAESWRIAARAGCIVFGGVTLLLLAAWAVLFVRQRRWEKREYDLTGMGLMLIIHYLIRVRMVGTIQMDEGLTCYLALRDLSYHPERILEDFIGAGKLADRIAYGYNFFALPGEFLKPGTGVGFQWVQLFMGVAAACSLYGIFKAMFPGVKKVIAWVCAFAVSVQPLFLGFSTMCGLEYGITVFFIYAFYCFVTGKYILMVFWLLMLGTTKGTGSIMALCFLGAVLVGQAAVFFLRKKGKMQPGQPEALQTPQEGEDEGPEVDFKSTGIAVLALAAVALAAYAVIRICRANGIEFSWEYIGIKASQLFVLNFNWIWVIVAVIGIGMVIANYRVRKTHKMQFVHAFVLTACYGVFNAYLFAYTKAGLVRYNMLADVLLAMIGCCLLIKMFERRRAVLSVTCILALLMFGEAFVTIDPVSASLYTTVNTNAFPMVFPVNFRWERAQLQNNVGDFGYYNYQYTFIDWALNDILTEFGQTEGDIHIISAYEGVEAQLGDENVIWDSKDHVRRYIAYGEDGQNIQRIRRVNVSELMTEAYLPERAILMVSPWCGGRIEDTLAMLPKNYDIVGPMVSDRGYAGNVEYYFIELKSGQ